MLTVMVSMTGVAATDANKTMSAHSEVELDIFSGMPNPSWTLTGDQTDDFRSLVANLPRAAAKVQTAKLGYRGFIVRTTLSTHIELVRIQNGTVEITDGITVVHALDSSRQVERWLLITGKPHLSIELVGIVQRSLR